MLCVLVGYRASFPEVVSPALKRMIESRPFPGALKRSFPRINARAPTPELCWAFVARLKSCPEAKHLSRDSRTARAFRKLAPVYSGNSTLSKNL
jgi:hypothetical protein